MDNEIENKITELQMCIEEGHSYDLDKDAVDGESILLECSVCGYTKPAELTDEQSKAIDTIFDQESALLDDILKNE